MITEDYVSEKTAELLKEKGFDEICYLGYNENGDFVLFVAPHFKWQ